METDPFPASIEYSVITSDVIKSFDCIPAQPIFDRHLISTT